MSGITQGWRCWCSSLVVGSVLIASLQEHVFAQITPDATLPNNSSVIREGNIFNITGGTQVGGNLFHSFREFSVPTGGVASFNNGVDIQNIFSRVTSGSVSNIDGLIHASGTANLFLINPNGIIFGQNARLDLGGSFIGSTANSLKFRDGTEFSAKTPQTAPLLTISVPIGLEFGGSTGDISVKDSKLEVPFGETLALVGGNVSLEGSKTPIEYPSSEEKSPYLDKQLQLEDNYFSLNAPGGRVELASVSGTSIVSLNQKNQGWMLGYDRVNNFSNIQLSQGIITGSYIDENAYPFYSIDSAYYIYNKLRLDEPDVQIAGRYITINGGDIYSNNLMTMAEQLKVQSTLIRSSDSGLNNYLKPKQININLAASELINLSKSDIYLDLIDKSLANLVNLVIDTKKLIIQDGSNVFITSSWNQTGNLTVNASESVEVIDSSLSASGNFSFSYSNLSDRFEVADISPAGNLTINTGKLIIRDLREGVINEEFIRLGEYNGAGNINVQSFGGFPPGNLTINASKYVEVIGGSLTAQFVSPQDVTPFVYFDPDSSYGGGGDITINTPQINIKDGGSVRTSSIRTGDAGNIKISARSVLLDNQAKLKAETASGQGGNITLQNLDLLLMRHGSQISTNAGTIQQLGDGGNISINAPSGFIVAVPNENSDITANAFTGKGGRLDIKANGIYGIEFRESPTPLSDITASSEFGTQGTVELNTPDVDPNSGLVQLPTTPVDTQVSQTCQAGGTFAKSSFTITGRGGLPPNPTTDILAPDLVHIDLVALKPSTREDKSPPITIKPTVTPKPIVEATGWVIDAKGEVKLIANAPAITPHASWQNPVSCRAS